MLPYPEWGNPVRLPLPENGIMRVVSLFVVTALLATGCGNSKVVPVSGKVTLEGKPLANAAVVFQPIRTEDNAYPGEGSIAKTDENGEFTLELQLTKGTKGAYVGKHRVEITCSVGGAAIDPNSDKPVAAKDRPVKIVDEKQEFEVPKGGTKEANFEVKRLVPKRK
jgi:hypothetical protein